MSELRKFPPLPEPDRERNHLRLVEATDFRPLPKTTRRPDSGLAWARAYEKKLLITDAWIIAITLIIALLTRSEFDRISQFFFALNPLVWLGLIGVAVVWLSLLQVFHTRDRRVIGTGANEYKRLITASMATFGLLSVTLVIIEAGYPGKGAVLAVAGGVVVLLVSRWLWRRWLTRQRRLGRALSRAVIVGTKTEVDYVVSKIKGNMTAAFAVVGVLAEPDEEHSPKSASPARYQFGADLVAETAAELGADAVIVAGDHGCGNDFIRNLAWKLEGTAAELILASRLANVAGPRIHFRPVEGLPLIHVEIPQFEGGKHVVKRGLDIAVSAIALIVLSPLFLLLALAVRLDTPGDAFFSQVRVGRNLETFRMFKFRSMVSDATTKLDGLTGLNEGSGVLFKLKNDPRITTVGRFIRKYSLDELPQIWNVLKGDMSLVGPRPPLPREVSAYQGKVNRRMYIKPGLTGMWQINGRSDLNWEDSMRLDLYYVENWSVVGDLVIMWRTFRVLIHPVGAY